MKVEFVAPQKVYQQAYSPSTERLMKAGYNIPIPVGLAKTKTGGMATIFPGHPYPRKTFIYSGITQPNNNAKRITLSLFLPFTSLKFGIKAFINAYLDNYVRLVDSLYSECDQVPYLHYQYYSEFGKNLWDFIYFFLRKLGVKHETAYRTGLQLTTMIEYDDAYKVRLQDILNESSKERLTDPRKELLRLIEIYKQREPAFFGEHDMTHAGARIIGFIKLIRMVFLIPKVKKAFLFALENTNFEWFKLDEWDYYWTLNRGDYNCGGIPFEERKQEMIDKMVEFTQKNNPDKEVRVVEENGQILIKTF